MDAKRMNFQLKAHSIVYERIPGFKGIPVDKIGLYQDEFRPPGP